MPRERTVILSRQGGSGLIEVAIALLVLSIGTLGLAKLQISARRLGYEALQRTEAVALAADLFERMRANRAVLFAYTTTGLGAATGSPLPAPATRCDLGSCTALQLTTWDLWQWERGLNGAATGDSAGGLVSPTGCVAVSGRRVTVDIVWQGFREQQARTEDSVCGAGSSSGASSSQWLSMTSWIAES